MPSLEDYCEIVGDLVIAQIHKKASVLYDMHMLHFNSTSQGGGVAEILASLVPVMNDIGIDVGWRLLHGDADFFSITKKFHNALQGESINLSEIKKRLYLETNEAFAKYTHINHDLIVIHDPQPLPMISFYKKRQPWIWRCHIDLSHPDQKLWQYLKKFILRYDLVIVSSETYKRSDLPVESRVIQPAIDPLTPKNMELSEKDITRYLRKFNIPTDKPIITQISRFDKWKDPDGVLEAFKIIKEKVDCRLILCGSMAADDPEGWAIYDRVKRKANDMSHNSDVIFITSENNVLVNVLQRVSDIIVQKSIREGFGLTVTEALWKGKPVVSTNVGGIPLQITDGENGYLVPPRDTQAFAERIIHLLENRTLAEEMGRKGRETVRQKFLITRLLSDYLDLFRDVLVS